jgi:hypothetical protein
MSAGSLCVRSPLEDIVWEQKTDPIAQEKLDFEHEAKAVAEAIMQARPTSSEKSVRFSEDQRTAKPVPAHNQPYVRKFKQRKMRRSGEATVQFDCDRVRKDAQSLDDEDAEDGQDEDGEEEVEGAGAPADVVETCDGETQTDNKPVIESRDCEAQTDEAQTDEAQTDTIRQPSSSSSGDSSLETLQVEKADKAIGTEEHEDIEEVPHGAIHQLTAYFQEEAVKILRSLTAEILDLNECIEAARDDPEALFDLNNALNEKQAERLALISFKVKYKIDETLDGLTPLQSPLESPLGRASRARGAHGSEEDSPVVSALKDRVRQQQEIITKLNVTASGADLVPGKEVILEERLDEFVEEKMTWLEQVRAACRFRHLVMQGRVKIMDKREKRLEDRLNKLDGREFDIVEGEKRLDEKKAREAAVAGMFGWVVTIDSLFCTCLLLHYRI